MQLIAEDMTSSTHCLIEKQKSQLNYILKWTKSQPIPEIHLSESLCTPASSDDAVSLLTHHLTQGSSPPINTNSLSPSSFDYNVNDCDNSSIFDSLNDFNQNFEEVNIDSLITNCLKVKINDTFSRSN